MLVIQRTGERKLQIRRQGAVHLLEEIIRRHLVRHRHIQNFLFPAAPVDSADANVSRICGLYPLEYATGSPERRSARIIAR